jgi:hypothetical protein
MQHYAHATERSDREEKEVKKKELTNTREGAKDEKKRE